MYTEYIGSYDIDTYNRTYRCVINILPRVRFRFTSFTRSRYVCIYNTWSCLHHEKLATNNCLEIMHTLLSQLAGSAEKNRHYDDDENNLSSPWNCNPMKYFNLYHWRNEYFTISNIIWYSFTIIQLLHYWNTSNEKPYKIFLKTENY